MYVTEVESGQCDGKATPVITKETAATAYVNGRNGIGTVRTRRIAIHTSLGISWIHSVSGCVHFLHGFGHQESERNWHWLGHMHRSVQ